MAHCMFSKKHPDLKGYYKCKLTGTIMKRRCCKYYSCKHHRPCYTPGPYERFIEWLANKF